MCIRDSRDTALARMRVALSEFMIDGVSSNIPLLRELVSQSAFIQGGESIHYLERWLKERKGC